MEDINIDDYVKSKSSERIGRVIWVGEKTLSGENIVMRVEYAIRVKWLNDIYGDLKKETNEFVRLHYSTVTKHTV